jgi:hypothetical protein
MLFIAHPTSWGNLIRHHCGADGHGARCGGGGIGTLLVVVGLWMKLLPPLHRVNKFTDVTVRFQKLYSSAA